MSHVVVMGLMGAGKSTVAEALARRLSRPWRDSDRDIEARTGRTGREIAAQQGVDELHRLEEAVLLDALAELPDQVIAAAGWVVESTRCRAALEPATVVFLDVEPAELQRRMASGRHRRALSTDELDRLVAARSPLFHQVADLVVDANGRPGDVVETILGSLGGITATKPGPNY